MAVEQPGPDNAQPLLVRGQLVHLRELSKRLAFGDVLSCDGTPVVVVFKDAARSEAAKLHCGDVVCVEGVADSRGAVLVSSAHVESYWKDVSPGVAFVKQPFAKHDATAEPATKPRAPCKFFLNTGVCALGDRCPRAHDAPRRLDALSTWVAARKGSRAAAAASSGDPHAGESASKAARARVFAAFLVTTFGSTSLRCGTGVLDVAGGAGALAFDLSVRHGVPATAVDPRPPKMGRAQHRLLSDARQSTPDNPPRLPGHVQALFLPETMGELCRGASCIVGLHPDGATDCVVDAAVASGLPFAVVPCCVFPSLMAGLRGGRVLRSREELIASLVARAPGASVAWLPIQGANKVVWRGATLPKGSDPGWRWDERSLRDAG